MKRAIIAAGLLASVSTPTILHAQDSDVLVMRRAIATPEGSTSIQPSPDYSRVPLVLRDNGENTYAIKGNIGLEIETNGCLLTSGVISTNAELCVDGQGPSVGDIINFPAEMDPDLRTYYVARSTYSEYLPHFSDQQIEQLCTGTIGISGETYQGSCDPAAVVNTYAWVANGLEDPSRRSSSFPGDMNPTADTDAINLYVNNIRCKLNSTGEIVDNSNCSGLGKSPANTIVEVAAVMGPEFRSAYVTSADVLAAAPDISQSAANAVCGKTVRVAGNNWTIDCGAPKDPSNYQRVADKLLDPYSNYSSIEPAMRYVNASADRGLLTLSVNGLRCMDYTSGSPEQGDYQDCIHLSEGPSQYDHVTFPAAYVDGMKAVYLERTDLEAALPHGGRAGFSSYSAYTPAELCDPAFDGFRIKIGGPNGIEDWTVFCGPPEDPADYARKVSQALDPAVFYPSGQYDVRETNSDFNGTSYAFSVKSTTCVNTVTGEPGGNKCDHLQEGPSVYDLVAVPAAYVPQLREIYVQRADLSSALGDGAGRASYYDSNSFYKDVDQICTEGLARIKVGPDTDRQEWTMFCGDPVDPANFKVQAQVLIDPFDAYDYSDRSNRETNSDPNATEYRFSVYRRSCTDTSTGETFDATRCDYLDGGLNDYDIVSMPASFVPELREVYIDRTVLEERYPALTAIDDGRGAGTSIDNICNGNERSFWVAGNSWTMFCGEPDDPARYADMPFSLVDPKNRYPNAEFRALNEDLSDGLYRFGVYATRCFDITDGSYAGATKCRYLTQNKAEQYDIVAIPVEYDIDNKEILVTRTALEEAMPYGAGASYYAGNYKNVDDICNGELRNLRAGPVATDTWKMVCVN